MSTIRTTRRLSQGKQPLHAHLHRVYSTSACPGGALHTPEGELAIGRLNKLPHEESPSRQWTGWRTNMLPRSSLHLPLDACSDAAADAIEASANRSHPRAFDLVVSGGGLAAFYGGAVSSVLATLARRGVLEVGSLHGVSSGALVCATFLSCEAGFTKLSDMYRCQDIFMGLQEGLQERRRPWLSYGMRQFLDESLPPDIHERATGRMHVTVSELLATQEGKVRRNLWPRKRVISHFPTREALLDTVMASTIIPGITAPHPHPTSCGGFQLDGAKVLAPPPSAEAPQLRIEQMAAARRLRYPKRWLLRTGDADVDVSLAMPALKDVVRLLGEGVQLPRQAMCFEDGSAPPRRNRVASSVHRVRSLLADRRARSKAGERAPAEAVPLPASSEERAQRVRGDAPRDAA